MSDPKTGLGYGLLGDTQTLRAIAAKSGCDNCPPEQPCPTCQDAQSGGDDQGQIIKTQVPIPMPGLFPPPTGLLPQQPSGAPIIGSPNAWWNWSPQEWGEWINGSAQSKPSQETEEMCEEQYARDTINFKVKKAYAGANAARVCHEQAAKAYADCLKNGRKSDIPRFDRK